MSVCCVQRWSLSLGRWFGVPVYVHIFLLLFAVLAVACSLPDMVGAGVLTVVVLLGSVLLHELAHTLAALRVGGKIDAIVLGPVGGLISPRVPDEPEVHLFVALAGPIVHLLLAVLAAIVLAAAGDAHLAGLLNPISTPDDLVEPDKLWLIAAKLTLWLNWVLMLLNFLPAYPFDGGPVLRAMLWPALGRRTARVVAARAAMVIAIGLCASSLLTLGSEVVTRVPIWIPLVTLGTFLLFSARQDLAAGAAPDSSSEPAGYRMSSEGLDLLDVDWSADEDEEGVLVEHQQRGQSEQSKREQEAFEDARVDDILARLHDSSLAELSPEEVAVLQRASQRYKQRLRPVDGA
jgi:stage IV sporulation protein FB